MTEQSSDQFASSRARAAAAREAHRALNAAARGPQPRAKSRRDVRARRTRARALETFRAALEAAYPPGFWDVLGSRYQRLAAGEAAAVEAAVRFLEADPWFFRSGYVKEGLLRRIKRLDLPPAVAARLRIVALNAVDTGDRREFRWYCRLARKVASPELRDALVPRLSAPDAGMRRRAGWMLAFIDSVDTLPERRHPR